MEPEKFNSTSGVSQSLFGEGVCIDPLSSYVLRQYAYFMTTSLRRKLAGLEPR